MSKKETKERIARAFCAMKAIGISEDKVKPVLKNLLKLYDKNWVLIEEENYRALADAIFEGDESEAQERSKKIVNKEGEEQSKKIASAQTEEHLEEEHHATEEPEQPLKRVRSRYHNGQTSSLNTSYTATQKTVVASPEEKLHKGKQVMVDSPEHNEENITIQTRAATPQPLDKNKGKQPISPESLIAQERCDHSHSQPNGTSGSPQKNRSRNEYRSQHHPMRLRDRRTGVVYAPISSRKKRRAPESSSHAVRQKEPNTEPGIPLSSENKSNANDGLIKPKDEPITNDIPCFEVPGVTVHPDTSNGGDSSRRDGDNRENYSPEPSATTMQSLSEKETSSDSPMPNELRNNGESVSGACSSSLEIASSPFGELKIYLTSDLASRNPDFRMPSLDAILKSVEDKCLRSSKTSDPYISMTKLMKEMCQCALKLSTDSSSSQSLDDVIDITNGQENVIITLVNEVNDEQPPSFHYIPRNGAFQNAHVNFSLARIGDNICCGTCSGDCLSLPTPCACSYESGGEFAYTTDGLIREDFLKECISMNRNPKKHCQYFCKECPLERSKGENVIEPCKGHLVRKFIKECWWKCGCHNRCGNRVVQRGITRKLQVFMTPQGKGWGLRTLEDLPKGAFVCEYVGEILTNAELFERVSRTPKGVKHSYPVLLDADWCAEGVLKDEEALCLDATYYGNVARFINHRCFDSNLVEIPVEIENPDHHYYHLAFFTTRKVKAMEELTWDYGIDFDDHEHPIKAFQCNCGSKSCRNVKRSRSRSSRRRR